MKPGHWDLFFYGGFKRPKGSVIGVGQIERLCLLKL